MNFGASKLSFSGNVTVEDLEAAGAFDGIKVVPVKGTNELKTFLFINEKKISSRSYHLFFLISGALLSSFTYAETHPLAIAFLHISIVIGGARYV